MPTSYSFSESIKFKPCHLKASTSTSLKCELIFTFRQKELDSLGRPAKQLFLESVLS